MAMTSVIEENNLEMYYLIWFGDISSSVLQKENIHIQQLLRALINRLKIIEDINECESYIRSLSKHDRVILIINNRDSQNLITCIHELPQVYSIYIYGKNQKRNAQWIQQFPKIKGVTKQLNELIAQIHSDRAKVNEPISMNVFNTNFNYEYSTTGLNGQFLHFQLLIDVLLRMKSNSTDKNELISLCENEYKDNRSELMILHEFKENYSSEQAIWWYTRESFIYRILNHALRTENIDLLFLFRFFIHDVEKQLRSNQCSSPVRVYRSQLISNNELGTLKDSIGQFISINSFFSTSLNRTKALSFTNQSNDYQRVLFEIDADPSLENIKPFSNITKYSYFPDEEEIIFMLGSIFRIVKINCDKNNLWIIQMILCSPNDNDLKVIYEYMKKQYGDNQTNLLSFGKILWTMGKLNEAEKYFLRLLNELPENHQLNSYCYRALGNVADDKGDYEASLKWHLKAIDIMRKTLDDNDPLLAESYNSIGCVYDTTGEYKLALQSYKKAFIIWKEIYGEDHLNVASCLNNIACVYAEREQYSKALEYYEKVLFIREKHLPRNHSDLGASHNNIGEVYRRLGQYDLALKHLNISLEIYRLSLPSQHPDKAEVLMNIGLVYEKQLDNKQALFYYEKASDIYHKTLNPTHSCVTKIHQLIQHLHSS